ncbi:MAG: TolC family protein [Acidobacteria bacterium]|nr:TolC family protein [Acidobacteriota bacterium]
MHASDALPNAPQPQTAQTAAAAPTFQLGPVAHIGKYDVPRPGPTPLRISLDDAVRYALENSTSIKIQKQNVRAIGGLQLTALNALIPSLSFHAQTSTQEVNLAAMGFDPSTVAPLLPPGVVLHTIVKYDTTSAQVNLSQSLFNLPAFEVFKASKSAAATVNYNYLLNRGDVVQRVATQYLRTLADVEAIRNAEAQLKSDTELTRQSRESHEAGVGTNLDYLRSRVEMQTREQELVSAQADFARDKIALARAMGLPADQELELSDAIPYAEIEQLPLDQAMKVAEVRRKDLLSLESQLRTAVLQRKAVAYERLPVLRVSGFYGVLGETKGLYHGVFTAQAGLDFPIFEEARIQGDKQMADAQIHALNDRIRGLRVDMEEQIRSAKLDVDSYRELARVARSNVELAQEALLQTQDRYHAGVEDDLPVVQAQATLADAQAKLIASLFQYNQAKIALARAIGVIETQYQTYLGKACVTP